MYSGVSSLLEQIGDERPSRGGQLADGGIEGVLLLLFLKLLDVLLLFLILDYHIDQGSDKEQEQNDDDDLCFHSYAKLKTVSGLILAPCSSVRVK